jgi:hypothetical protein
MVLRNSLRPKTFSYIAQHYRDLAGFSPAAVFVLCGLLLVLARHAYMNLVSFTNGQGCRRDRGFKCGFLCAVLGFDFSVVQDSPLASLEANDRVLCKSHIGLLRP